MEDETLSAKELAQRLEVSEPTIQKWCKAGCPRHADKSFDLVQVCRWLSDRAYRGKAKQNAWNILRAYQTPAEGESSRVRRRRLIPLTEPYVRTAYTAHAIKLPRVRGQ